jgi:hypothetical protein
MQTLRGRAYPYGSQFHTPYDRPDLIDRQVDAAQRAGQLLADAALVKMGSTIEALAWLRWTWRTEPMDEIDRLTRDAASVVVQAKASASERAVWAQLLADDSCASLDDVRWWLEVEAPRLIDRLRERAA